MPLTNLQRRILSAVAAHRTLDSHVAGGSALNRGGQRVSADIDFFRDPHIDVAAVAERDVHSLETSGLRVTWRTRLPTFQSADIADDEDATRLDWARDSAWRFYPAQPDAEFGYMLHPVDLATNKALAAASRGVARDSIDLMFIHEHVLPLGAVVCAAVGKDEGFSPESLLNFISRFAPKRPEEFVDVISREPLDVPDLRRRFIEATHDALDYIAQIPSDHVGCIFIDGGRAVAPSPGEWDRYERLRPSIGGALPTSPEISSSMLAR